ncbi:hypothetical protein [Acidovorax sp. sic0104]|uniref:hypothetical protein n=1 Tax=Acidovorax sp. sic0104 TaxID=2854784 RepID=UPI001C447558|nr:hypothetical protein [Acidovorax sp. sic0104]MBV7544659.1 hypothetical protein [Acidovorax sp. sic0104]
MKLPNIDCARHIRDGGIDAMAALNEALRDALVSLDLEDQQRLKRVFGEVMAEVSEKIINPAISAFPELDPDETTWAAVVRATAKARSYAA